VYKIDMQLNQIKVTDLELTSYKQDHD